MKHSLLHYRRILPLATSQKLQKPIVTSLPADIAVCPREVRFVIPEAADWFGVSLEIKGYPAFSDVWANISCSYIDGEESSQFLIERCLMRPRALIDLVNACKSHAVNLGKETMEEEDLREGVRQYSREMVENVNFEIQDVSNSSEDILYAFVESPRVQLEDDVLLCLMEHGIEEGEAKTMLDLLMYYAVFGIEDGDQVGYIYDFSYDRKKMAAVANKRRASGLRLAINPAFWGGLDTKE